MRTENRLGPAVSVGLKEYCGTVVPYILWFNLGNASHLAQTLDAAKAARLCESAWSLPAVVGLADCGKMDLLFSITLLCCNIVMQVPWLKQNAEPRALSFGPFWDWNSKQLMCQHGLITWKSIPKNVTSSLGH